MNIQINVYETFLMLKPEASSKSVEQKLEAACKFIKTFNYNEKDKYRLEPSFARRLLEFPSQTS